MSNKTLIINGEKSSQKIIRISYEILDRELLVMMASYPIVLEEALEKYDPSVGFIAILKVRLMDSVYYIICLNYVFEDSTD